MTKRLFLELRHILACVFPVTVSADTFFSDMRVGTIRGRNILPVVYNTLMKQPTNVRSFYAGPSPCRG